MKIYQRLLKGNETLRRSVGPEKIVIYCYCNTYCTAIIRMTAGVAMPDTLLPYIKIFISEGSLDFSYPVSYLQERESPYPALLWIESEKTICDYRVMAG